MYVSTRNVFTDQKTEITELQIGINFIGLRLNALIHPTLVLPSSFR